MCEEIGETGPRERGGGQRGGEDKMLVRVEDVV